MIVDVRDIVGQRFATAHQRVVGLRRVAVDFSERFRGAQIEHFVLFIRIDQLVQPGQRTVLFIQLVVEIAQLILVLGKQTFRILRQSIDRQICIQPGKVVVDKRIQPHTDIVEPAAIQSEGRFLHIKLLSIVGSRGEPFFQD